MEFDREWFQTLPAAHLRIHTRFERITQQYAVMLQTGDWADEASWQTILLIDNHLGEPHIHRYNADTKEDPERFSAADGVTVNEQIIRAIEHIADHHAAIHNGWINR